jgi:hypothetical protein
MMGARESDLALVTSPTSASHLGNTLQDGNRMVLVTSSKLLGPTHYVTCEWSGIAPDTFSLKLIAV